MGTTASSRASSRSTTRAGRSGTTTSEDYLQETMECYLNDHVVKWDVETGDLDILYSVETAFANPIDNYLEQPNSMTYGACDCPTATDGSLQVLDWSHASAVSESDYAYV